MNHEKIKFNFLSANALTEVLVMTILKLVSLRRNKKLIFKRNETVVYIN